MMKKLGVFFFLLLITLLLFNQKEKTLQPFVISSHVQQEVKESPTLTKQALLKSLLQKKKNERPQNQQRIVQQLQVLNEILSSKNDNDPRLDTDFQNLSLEVKRRFREKYKNLPKEKVNSRGTVLFILGENLRSQEDIEFFKTVLSESPCLSLENCYQKPSHNDPHIEDLDAVTLVYPQLVTLQAFENNLQKIQSRNLREMIKEGLLATKMVDHPMIRQMAHQMIKKHY